MYLPSTKQFGPEGSYLVVRSKLPPPALATTVMGMLREINPGQSAAEFKPIQMLVDRATSPRRFFVMLVGAFAGLGLLLAALGIYGVISYSVTQRTQEIGVRMALGAARGDVLRLVLGQGMWTTTIGVAIGIAGSLALTRTMQSLLFGVSPTDSVTLAGVVLLLAGVSMLACWIPTRRAMRVDPIVALRYE